MEFELKNLGVLKCARIKLSDLTIICGKNNTGKTYATYTIYGFLSYWWEDYELDLDPKIINTLLETGTASIPISQIVKKAQQYIDSACNKFNPLIKRVFSSNQETLSNATLKIQLSEGDIKPLEVYEQITGSDKMNLFSIQKEITSDNVVISLLVDRGSIKIPHRVLQRSISFTIKKIIFENTFPDPVILVAERTGIEIFQAELDFAKNRLLDMLKESEGGFNPLEIFNKVNTDYALPINRAVDAVRRNREIVKNQSFIQTEHPEIIQFLNEIIGGDIIYSKNIMYFVPSVNKRLRLKINESSSSVRSLVDLAIYIKHLAKKGDLLMIDEPELNLHPENQRKLMQLFALLINAGIKIFTTTHSDYIVKELNNIKLISSLPEENRLRFYQEYGYNKSQMLDKADIAVYVASIKPILLDNNKKRTKCNTFEKVVLGHYGFELGSFDDTINIMNEIQDELLYGDYL